MIQPIAPIVDCSADLQCSGSVETGRVIPTWQCIAQVSCYNRTAMSSSTDGVGDWTARCSLDFSAAHNTGLPVTVDNPTGGSRWSTALPGCPYTASQNSTTAAGTQPTTHAWRPSSGIALLSSKPTIRPRPIRTHDPKITSSAAATSGLLTNTVTLVSTITVFLTLAA
ncbi:hypothetical protein CI102_12886 [Trichoderma harzianum]|nr:hypothetical protein CI102_12886 [Trichoderma harzianum]